MKSNRRNRILGVSAAVTVDGRDAIVELTGTYLQRVTEVLAHKVAISHPCDRDMQISWGRVGFIGESIGTSHCAVFYSLNGVFDSRV
ncbi:hypothetical protein FJ709_00940 [Shewanella glacialimarina]|jgi:deoxyxylulose-5-phosphate synthase|nr:hypothetical protein FJ709_00940 [Shewanella glacialimarina]